MKFLYIKERLCSMKVSRERLQIIGKMIGILREEKRQNKQNSWTQIRFCENICSPNTLKSIESGKVGRSDAIYEQLLAKLDLKYDEFPIIDDAFIHIIDGMHTAIEYYDLTLLKQYIAKGIKILEKAKTYVYYSELYDVLKEIYAYYIESQTISIQKSQFYMKLLDIFDDKLIDILKLLIFAGVKTKCISDIEYYSNCIVSLNLEKSDFSCAKINLLHYYLLTKQKIRMVNLIGELEKYFTENNNVVRLLDVYNCSLVLLSSIDKSYTQEYVSKVEDLINNVDIPKDKISESYANIASSYYYQKDYSHALKYLQEAVKGECEDLIINYILIADCQNRLGLDIKTIKKRFPKEIRVMYNYFLSYMGEEIPPMIKQKIIISRVAPVLEDDVNIDIFLFELRKLIKETNSYKDLYLFQQIVEKK